MLADPAAELAEVAQVADAPALAAAGGVGLDGQRPEAPPGGGGSVRGRTMRSVVGPPSTGVRWWRPIGRSGGRPSSTPSWRAVLEQQRAGVAEALAPAHRHGPDRWRLRRSPDSLGRAPIAARTHRACRRASRASYRSWRGSRGRCPSRHCPLDRPALRRLLGPWPVVRVPMPNAGTAQPVGAGRHSMDPATASGAPAGRRTPSCRGARSSGGSERSGSGCRSSARSSPIADEQLAHLADEADDARLRALVSETPLAEREHREAAPPRRVRCAATGPSVAAEIAQLEHTQDELLDRLLAERLSASDPAAAPGASRPPTAAASREGRRPVATRVVIAEDEAIIRLDLKETLEEEGYEVVGETGRGDEAVELVKPARARPRHPRHQDAGPRRPVGRPGDRRRAPGRRADPHRLQPARPHRAGPRRRCAGLPGEAVPAQRADPRHRGRPRPLHRRCKALARPGADRSRTSSRPASSSTGPRASSWTSTADRERRLRASSRSTAMRERVTMKAVAEQIIAGELDAGPIEPEQRRRRRRPNRGRDDARSCSSTATRSTYRAFFALPDRHGHRVRAGHQRGLRVHVDAHQPAARPPARPRRRGLRPARAHVPPRARSTTTRPTARRPPTSCASRWAWSARWSTSLRHPDARDARVRGRRHHRHARHRGPRPRRRRHHRHRRPRRLPAGRGPPHQGPLQQAGRVRLRPLRRGRHPRAHRRHPDAVRPVRRAAGRHLRQPARRPRGGGEDGRQAHQQVRRPRRHLRPPRRADAQAAAEPRRARGPGPQERRAHGAGPRRRPLDVDPDDARHGRARHRGGARALRLPRVPHAVPTALAEALGDVASAPARRGRGARGRGRRRHRHRAERGRGAGADRSPAPTALARRRALGGDRVGGPGVRLEGLALVADAATADVAWLADGGPVADDVGPAPRSRRWSATVAARSSPTHAKAAHPGAARPRASRSRTLALDTELAAYLLDPAEARYEPRRAAAALRPRSSCPSDGDRRRTASSTSAASDRPGALRTARARSAVAPPGRPLHEALDARGLRDLNDEIEVPLVRVLAEWRIVGVGVDVGRAAGAQRPRSSPSATACASRSEEDAGRGVQRQLHAADARGPLRRARAHAAEEDEDRLLHRRRVAREAAGPAPDHRAPAGLPRGREAPLAPTARAC